MLPWVPCESLMKALSLDRIRALEALLRTRSPASAATELGVARSTASKTLGRLRSELNDQLLIRRGDQMVLTRRAEQLVGTLGARLGELEKLLEGDVGQARQSATISMRDEFVLAIAPALVKQFGTQSPHATLKIVPYDVERLVENLARRTVDVAITADSPRDSELCSQLLYRETFVCLTAERVPLDLERYLSAPHVTTMSHGWHAAIDAALARNGHKRKIVAKVPHIAALMQAVENGMCATLPCRVVLAMRPAQLVVHALPFPMPDLQVSLTWHRRFEQDPANRWLRGLVVAAAGR
jgi:DNA-binding transcriptional LysR family regulator